MRSRYLVIPPILLGRFGSNLLFGTSCQSRILSLRLIHAMHALTSKASCGSVLSISLLCMLACRHLLPQMINNQGCGAGAGAGAGAAGADRFWSEPEPEPEPPTRFARGRSRSRQKQGGSGSEKGYNCGKKKQNESEITRNSRTNSLPTFYINNFRTSAINYLKFS